MMIEEVLSGGGYHGLGAWLCLNQARLLHLLLIFSVINTTLMPTAAATPIAISMVVKMLILFSSGLVV